MQYQKIPPEQFKQGRYYDHKKHQLARIAQEQARGFFLFGKRQDKVVKQWGSNLKRCLALVQSGDERADTAINSLVQMTNQIKDNCLC